MDRLIENEEIFKDLSLIIDETSIKSLQSYLFEQKNFIKLL